jgi:hypothetical protein
VVGVRQEMLSDVHRAARELRANARNRVGYFALPLRREGAEWPVWRFPEAAVAGQPFYIGCAQLASGDR